MKIAVIDNGIDTNFNDFYNKNIEIITITDSLKNDNNGHGSSCIGEILRINEYANILYFEVSDKKLINIIKALEKCKNRGIKVISLSFSCEIREKEIIDYFQNLINQLIEEGIIIIASIFNRKKNPGFPSNLKGVIGVKFHFIDSEEEYFLFDRKREKIDYYGNWRLMPFIDGNYKFFKGNSSATPRVAAHIYSILANDKIKTLNDLPKLNKIYITNDIEKNNQINKILKKIILCYNKICLKDIYSWINNEKYRHLDFKQISFYRLKKIQNELFRENN